MQAQAGFELRVRESFARQAAMATVAARLALRRRGLDADAGRRRVTMAGRTISVTEGRALQFSGDGGDELPVATMTATMMTVVGRDGPRA